MSKFSVIVLITCFATAGCSDATCGEDSSEVTFARSLSDARFAQLYSDTVNLVYRGFGTLAPNGILDRQYLPESLRDINAQLVKVNPDGIHIRLKDCKDEFIDLIVIDKRIGEPRIELWYVGRLNSGKEILWRSGED